MKINLAIIVSFIVLLIGLFVGENYLWIPISVLIAGVIDLLTRQWVISDRLGSVQTLSIMLKSLLALIGLYAMIGQIACVILLIWWFIF